MPVSYIPYDLQKGYIHHWLIAGPQAIAVQTSGSLSDGASKTQIAQHYYEEESGIHQLPVEPGPLKESMFTVADYEGQWAYFSCTEDHFVDLTAFSPSYRYLRAWAYTQLECARAQAVSLVLTTHGPSDVWLNGSHIHRSETFGLHHDTFEALLHEGANELLVRFEQIGERACMHQFALRISGPVNGVNTRVPTAIVDIAHRNKLEAMFNRAYLDRDVFTRDEIITVHWPDDLGTSDDLTIRLQTPSRRIYAESKASASPEQPSTLVRAHDAPQGPLRLRFMPRQELFYEQNLRVLREIPLWGMGLQTYSDVPYGTYPQRRVEALRHAARSSNLFAEMAKMALGQWEAVEPPAILRDIETINRREVSNALYLVGLLGIVHRHGDHKNFPASLKNPLEDCILNFKGWEDKPGPDNLDVTNEGTLILLHTSEILAGQLYPDRIFSHSGQTGQWHRERGERLALDWLRHRGAGGFAAWDSGRTFEAELVALSHLMDLAETEIIWEMVTVIMDKLLLTIALNSYQGVFGATQGAADVTSIKGGLLAPTAGITRLLWGEGVFNHHIAGIVSMACMEDYALPPLVSDIATTRRNDLWNRECHVMMPAEAAGAEAAGAEAAGAEAAGAEAAGAEAAGAEAAGAEAAGKTVNKVTYRTPDYLLASAQDHRPGGQGKREHVWQATLGPEAVVYTTHPACMGQSEAHTPGFWLGNATLPRVAQWKDVLIAVYNLPNDDWMGYTHAYFPTYAFDTYVIRENTQGQSWAFAQKGEGYVALTASRGLVWMTQGPGAYRELRSYGQNVIWCCQMGRAALDGDFETFQERVLAQPLTFGGLAVRFETLRGKTLAFGWEGPLLYNGEEQPLSGFKHYENPYCVTDLNAPGMEIRSDKYLMRLKFT